MPDNNGVFGGENGGERNFFAYFDLVSSRGGGEWPFLCPLGSLGRVQVFAHRNSTFGDGGGYTTATCSVSEHTL